MALPSFVSETPQPSRIISATGRRFSVCINLRKEGSLRNCENFANGNSRLPVHYTRNDRVPRKTFEGRFLSSCSVFSVYFVVLHVGGNHGIHRKHGARGKSQYA